MNKIEIATTTYQGEEIQCAKFTIDTTPANWRFPNVLLGNGDYAWQWVIKAESSTNVSLRVGNQISYVHFGTTWDRWTHVYESVDVSAVDSSVNIAFPVGVFYCYHTKLEKGDTVTDWSESDVDISYSLAQQTADMLSWIVAGGDSASTFTLTPRTAELVAQYINLNGLVTFTALNNQLQTMLNEFQSEQNASYAYSANAPVSHTWSAVTDDFTAGHLTPTVGQKFYIKFSTALTNQNDYQLKINNSTTYMIWYNRQPITSNMQICAWDRNQVIEVEFKQISSSLFVWDMIMLPNNSSPEAVVASKLGKLCSDANMTIVNGGKLATGSVTADKINVNSLQAISAILGGFTIADNNITNTNSSTDITQNPQIKFERNTGNAYEYAYVIYSFPTYELYYRDFQTTAGSHYPTDVKISINDKGSLVWKYNQYPSTGSSLPTESDYETTPTQTYTNSMGLPLELGSDLFSHYYGNGAEFSVPSGKQIQMRKTSTAYGENAVLDIDGKLKASSIECQSFNNIRHDRRSVTIGANVETGFALQYATNVIGNNPIVQITLGNRYFKVSSISTSTSGTNTIVTIQIVNESNSQETGMVYTSLFYSHNYG